MTIKPTVFALTVNFVLLVSSSPLLDDIYPLLQAVRRSGCQYENYAFDPVSRKCWKLNTRGPCGAHMEFERIDGYPLGSCKCIREDNPCDQRYVVISNPTLNCHKYFTQGPCKSDEWLVPTYFNEERTARCAKNVCLGRMDDLIVDNARPFPHPKFFFGHEGICYVTGTQAFCPPGQVALFVNGMIVPDCYPEKDTDTPICSSEPPIQAARSKRELPALYSAFGGRGSKCPAGYEQDMAGECARVSSRAQLDTSSEQADDCQDCY